MEHHHLFHIISAGVLIGAIIIALTVGLLPSIPFFLFAVAITLRGVSLHKKHAGFKGLAYAVFIIGIIMLIWSFVG